MSIITAPAQFFNHILTCLLFTSMLMATPAAADVKVVTTIRPLALIALAVLGEHGEVTALVDNGQSPHHYSMTPSDRIALARADVLVRVDATFELYLNDIYDNLGEQREQITISELDGVVLHHDSTGELDPHLWLDTINATIFAEKLADTAARLDPENGTFFLQNRDRFNVDITTLNEQIGTALAQANSPNYVVFHDAFRYFEARYGLQHGFSLVINPDVEPSVQQILQARNIIKTSAPDCLLMEADANLAIINTMLGESGLRHVTVDLLGTGVKTDSKGYFQMLSDLAQRFSACRK
jgi:zinc transport system substrate-binding protein